MRPQPHRESPIHPWLFPIRCRCLAKFPVVPVLTIDDAKKAVPLAQALLAGGLAGDRSHLAHRRRDRGDPAHCAECAGRDCRRRHGDETRRYRRGREGRREISGQPGNAGRTRPRAWPRRACRPFPAARPRAKRWRLPISDFKTLKFFPAESSRRHRLAEIDRGPLPDLRFCPTGGIDGKMPRLISRCRMWSRSAAPGSRRRPPCRAGDFARITTLAKEAKALRA